MEAIVGRQRGGRSPAIVLDIVDHLAAIGPLVRRPGAAGRRWWLTAPLLAATLADLLTTEYGMRSRQTEEVNPGALLGMDLLGPDAYAVGASALCASFTLLLLPVARTPGARLLVGWVWLVTAVKMYFSIHNASLLS